MLESQVRKGEMCQGAYGVHALFPPGDGVCCHVQRRCDLGLCEAEGAPELAEFFRRECWHAQDYTSRLGRRQARGFGARARSGPPRRRRSGAGHGGRLAGHGSTRGGSTRGACSSRRRAARPPRRSRGAAVPWAASYPRVLVTPRWMRAARRRGWRHARAMALSPAFSRYAPVSPDSGVRR
jgi:hypothetical protein